MSSFEVGPVVGNILGVDVNSRSGLLNLLVFQLGSTDQLVSTHRPISSVSLEAHPDAHANLTCC